LQQDIKLSFLLRQVDPTLTPGLVPDFGEPALEPSQKASSSPMAFLRKLFGRLRQLNDLFVDAAATGRAANSCSIV